MRFFSFATVAVVVIAAAAYWPNYWQRRYELGFSSIKTGDSLEAVRQLMGRKGDMERCGTILSAPAECDRELVYSHAFLPAYWIVWLGQDGRVIGTYMTSSP